MRDTYDYRPPTPESEWWDKFWHELELYSLAASAARQINSGRYDGARISVFNRAEADVVARHLDALLPNWRDGLVGLSWYTFGQEEPPL